MIVGCRVCGKLYDILSQPGQSEALLDREEWRLSFPCVTPLCGGRATRITDSEIWTDLMHATSKAIPVETYFRALMGFGLTDGDPAPAAEVQKLLASNKIADVIVREVGQPQRTIVEKVIMQDGTRLHFAASGEGACVYLVEKPPRSCLEVFDESGPQRPHECSDEDRKEARPGVEGCTEVGHGTCDGALERLPPSMPTVQKER